MDINGKKLVNIPHAVSDLITNDERQDQAISELEEAVRQALVGVFHYKGSVATYADLPVADNQVGDVYNVLDTGANYAWAGTEWDDLSGIVDLSNYVTIDGDETITGLKTFSGGIKTDDIGGIGTEMLIGRSGYPIKARSGIRPNSSGSIDLGVASSQWRSLYLTNGLYFGTDGGSIVRAISNIAITAQLGDITFKPIANGSLRPYDSGTYNLGSSSYKWADLYLSGTINISDWSLYQDASNRLMIKKGNDIEWLIDGTLLRPYNTNTNDIGTSNSKLRDVYLAGKLSDGTNSVTVADIANGLFNVPASVSISDGGTISDTTLQANIQNHRPINLNGYTGYFSCDDGTNYQYHSIIFDSANNVNHLNVATINKTTWVVTFHTSNFALN